ncbi:MAG: nucleotidyltransferase family protein [bacterium]
MTALTILIPAAGSASRMRGGDKLMEQVEGQPLLRRQVRMALATSCPVIVTLRPEDSDRSAALDGLNVAILPVPDAASGMSASLRRAVRSLTSALMILPADMPDLTTEDLQTLIAAFALAPEVIHRGASEAGQPGHPVILPRQFLPDIARLEGDSGARSIVEGQKVRSVPLPDAHATTDLDTPEDWATWRSRRVGPDRA